MRPPPSPGAASVVTTEHFAALLARLGPFEPHPRLAVALSGGADSLALCLLCQKWTEARGGSVLALTVDHRLRPESTLEAATVGQRLGAWGIEHQILTWDGAKPLAGIQEAAREARYRLLIEHAASRGIFHLLLAHHREDQAETLLLRLAHGSGLDGLAGMAAIRELPALRLLRPLLEIPKAALIATCTNAGATWVEDPSNRSPAYARARLRAAADALGREGLSAKRLATTARRLGEARAALDDATATLLAHTATLHDAGFLTLDPAPLHRAPAEIGKRALGRCLALIGGASLPPRRERLEALWDAIAAGLPDGRTLAGCRILTKGARLLIVREPRACAGPAPLPLQQPVWWDRRFQAVLRDGPPGLTLGPLGAAGWLLVRAHVSPASRATIPQPVRAVLPAILDEHGPLLVPHLGFRRTTAEGNPGTSHPIVATLRFLTATALAGSIFAVA